MLDRRHEVGVADQNGARDVAKDRQRGQLVVVGKRRRERRQQRGGEEHRELDRPCRVRLDAMQAGQDAVGEGEGEHEGDAPANLLAQRAPTSADAEGEPAVGGRVRHAGALQRRVGTGS